MDKKVIYVDIDNTICTQVTDSKYENAKPWLENIEKINIQTLSKGKTFGEVSL